MFKTHTAGKRLYCFQRHQFVTADPASHFDHYSDRNNISTNGNKKVLTDDRLSL